MALPTLATVSRLEAASPPPFLEPLARALVERRLVRVAYCSVRGDETERDVAVLGLAFRDGGWMAACHCQLRDALRAFHVSRVRAARLGGPAPAAPCFFDRRGFSVLPLRDPPDAPAVHVAIRLDPPMAALASALLPGLSELGEGGARYVHLRTSRPETVVALALSLGRAAELVHPPELARVARRLRARAPGLTPWLT